MKLLPQEPVKPVTPGQNMSTPLRAAMIGAGTDSEILMGKNNPKVRRRFLNPRFGGIDVFQNRHGQGNQMRKSG